MAWAVLLGRVGSGGRSFLSLSFLSAGCHVSVTPTSLVPSRGHLSLGVLAFRFSA